MMADTVEKAVHLSVKLAETLEDLERAYRLRYQVFVEEAGNERLANEEKVEQDRFDLYCDHLIVTDMDKDEVVGTYRLLPGDRAVDNIGFYSETEFDLRAFDEYKRNTLELGRSCIAPNYRNGKAIQLLWAGIARYIQQQNFQYLIGCASVPLSSVEELNEIYSMLKIHGILKDRYGIQPLNTHRVTGLQDLPIECSEKEMIRRLPPLMKGYQWLGAEIGGEPAYDPVFHTYDFLIILDTAKVTRRYRRHFLDQ